MVPIVVLALGLMLASSCIIPIDYQDPEDAGADYPPVIEDPVPPMPCPTDNCPLVLSRSATGEPYTILVRDNDLGEKIYVRVFRRCDESVVPLQDLEKANDPDLGEALRTIEIQHPDWCNDVANGITCSIKVVVADRPFVGILSSESIEDVPGLPAGMTTSSSWMVSCTD